MSLLSELKIVIEAVGLPVETGVFSDEPPDEYVVVTPLADTYELHADNLPEYEIQEARLSLFSRGNYLKRKKQLSAAIAPGVHCRGDEALLRRLAAILLDNAVKYCDAGGRIQVELHLRRHPVLTVENTYAEVDKLQLDRLFDRFYRADKARTFTGSFGIGLSIAQSIARKHRGSLTAYKKEGIIGFRAELKER